jgi:prepilin-type N-terminal cleavage/methylation domain-containing protein
VTFAKATQSADQGDSDDPAQTSKEATCAPLYLAQSLVEVIEKLPDQKGDDGLTPTERVLGVADHIGRTGERGFTIVELIVVVTIISMLSALAAGAYNKVVNDAKQANANALVSTLATAKTAFVTDPSTSPTEIQQFNSDPEASFASIAPYIRINGVQPVSADDLKKLDGLRMPQKMDAALASHPALFQRGVIDVLPGISTHRLKPLFCRERATDCRDLLYPDVALASSFLTLEANVRLTAERVL